MSVSPPQRSVRPTERRKSVSPAKSIGWSPSSRKQVEPGVWPGVWTARRTYGPKRMRSPSEAACPEAAALPRAGRRRRPVRAGVVERPVGRMQPDRRSRRFLDRPRARDVIEVRVRVDERHRRGFADARARRMRSGSSPGSMTIASRETGSAITVQLLQRPDRSVSMIGSALTVHRHDGVDVVALAEEPDWPRSAPPRKGRAGWPTPGCRCAGARRRRASCGCAG